MNTLDVAILAKYGHTNYSVCVHTEDGVLFHSDLIVAGSVIEIGTNYASEELAYEATETWVINNT